MSDTFNALTSAHFHQRDPGVIWDKDPHIAIDLDSPLDSESILTPNVVRWPSGGYRMYYTGLGPAHSDPNAVGYILSAYSADGLKWSKDEGIRIDLHPPRAHGVTVQHGQRVDRVARRDRGAVPGARRERGERAHRARAGFRRQRN